MKLFQFREGFRQYVLNEGTYIIGDIFLGITGDEDYRELGVDSERILGELTAGYRPGVGS